MTRDEFLALMQAEHQTEYNLFAKKNSVYGYNGLENILENFERGGVILDMPPEKYLMSLVTKHFLALSKADATPELYAEYARDIRLYMLLLLAIVKDRKA
ncbi:MAG: hypothetical protein QXS54_07650 [Candidatus Methanomethylicaceae archaeon]